MLGQVVGAALTGQDGLRGYLYQLAVAPIGQGQGIGRSLAARAIGDLLDAGIKLHHILVLLPDEDARRFWAQPEWDGRVRLITHHHISTR